MRLQTQAEFEEAVRKELWKRKLSITELAARINKSRQAVSLAINHGLHGNVRTKISKELGL